MSTLTKGGSVENSYGCEILKPVQQKAIVDAMLKAYSPAMDAFDEEAGIGNTAFGFLLWSTGRKALTDYLTDVDGVHIISKGNKFEIKIDQKVMKFYRVGNSTYSDINHSFPRNKNAGKLHEGTYQIEFDLGEELEKSWIIAHIGNPEDGLIGLFLCKIEESENGEIKKWNEVHCLYEAQEFGEFDLEEKVFEDKPIEENEIEDQTVITIKEVPVEREV